VIFDKYSEKNLLRNLDEPEVEYVDWLALAGNSGGKQIPDPVFVIRMDGTYDCRSLRHGLRANGHDRNEALARLNDALNRS